ncbi:MAG: Rossmann-like domain-containing protein [Promethearchaeota archaeon]
MSQHILEIINPYRKLEEDLMDLLEINKNSKIIFIGEIKPLIRKIGKISDSIIIVDNSISELASFKRFKIASDINQLKEEELATNVLFCTGTALINNTMEEVLEKFKRKAQQIIVIGPTASMFPDILFDQGVDIVSGMKILDSDSTIKVLQEGGGTKIFKQYGLKYSLIKE